MAKLITLDDAAAQLGMTTEQVLEARSKNQIFGYRDGTTWKFKETELERFAQQKGVELGGDESPTGSSTSSGSLPKIADIDADLDELVDVADVSVEDEEQDTDGPDSVLVSEEELGSSEHSAGSTIIGKDELSLEADDLPVTEDDDLPVTEIDEPAGVGSSDLRLAGASDIGLAGDSEIRLAESGLLDGSGSELRLDGSGSELKIAGDSTGGSELRLASDTVGSNLMTGDDLVDAEDEDDDDLILDAETLEGESLELSDDELLLESDSVSSLDLDVMESDVDVLEGGSDITLNASDSGINLTSPSDSGISLENTPRELGGSGVEALELGEADFIELGDEEVDDLGATELKADDDFLLTPVEGGASDEPDSGSQVIALDEADEVDETGDTMLADADMLDADEAVGLADEPVAAAAAAPATLAAPIEAEYSLWNVVGLGCCLFFLALVGIMMTDLLRNMWSWNQEYSLNSTLMDAIVNLLP
jgi:hypothetical protein